MLHRQFTRSSTIYSTILQAFIPEGQFTDKHSCKLTWTVDFDKESITVQFDTRIVLLKEQRQHLIKDINKQLGFTSGEMALYNGDSYSPEIFGFTTSLLQAKNLQRMIALIGGQKEIDNLFNGRKESKYQPSEKERRDYLEKAPVFQNNKASVKEENAARNIMCALLNIAIPVEATAEFKAESERVVMPTKIVQRDSGTASYTVAVERKRDTSAFNALGKSKKAPWFAKFTCCGSDDSSQQQENEAEQDNGTAYRLHGDL